MLKVDCFLGYTRPNVHLFGLSFGEYKQFVEAVIASASRPSNSHPPRIRFRLRENLATEAVIPPSQLVKEDSLNRALSNMILGQPSEPNHSRAGLLLADYFQPRPSVLGYMFDAGPPFYGHPREGCAVFTGAIWDLRQNQGERAPLDEFLFTTMHEIGHMFNLPHLNNKSNFMSESYSHAPFGINVHDYHSAHCEYLQYRLPGSLEYVKPGGTRFGDRAPGFDNGGYPIDFSLTNDPKTADILPNLQISTELTEAWYFEPIELGIKLIAPNQSDVKVLNRIDPGYENFKIWIEKPDGSRCRLASTKTFHAPNFEFLEIQAGEAWQRDIPIIADAKGFVFGLPGEHQLWVTYTHIDGRVVQSNKICLNIKANNFNSKLFNNAAAALSRPNVLHLSYFQDAILRRPDLDAIRHILKYHGKSYLAATLRYSLAKRAFSRIEAGSRKRKDMTNNLIDSLKRSKQCEALSEYRRAKSSRMLEELRQKST